MFVSAKMYEKAVAACDRAVALKANCSSAFRIRAACFRIMGQPEKAIEDATSGFVVVGGGGGGGGEKGENSSGLCSFRGCEFVAA